MCYASQEVYYYKRDNKVNNSPEKLQDSCVKNVDSNFINGIINKYWNQYATDSLNSKTNELKALLQEKNINNEEHCSKIKNSLDSFNPIFQNLQKQYCAYDDHIDTGSLELDNNFKDWIDITTAAQNLIDSEC